MNDKKEALQPASIKGDTFNKVKCKNTKRKLINKYVLAYKWVEPTDVVISSSKCLEL